MLIERELGFNPFKFGMIGSTNSRAGLATAEEENFFGKHSGVEPDRALGRIMIQTPDPALAIFGWKQAAGGLTTSGRGTPARRSSTR